MISPVSKYCITAQVLTWIPLVCVRLCSFLSSAYLRLSQFPSHFPKQFCSIFMERLGFFFAKMERLGLYECQESFHFSSPADTVLLGTTWQLTMLFRFRVAVNGNGRIWYADLVLLFYLVILYILGFPSLLIFDEFAGDCLCKMQLQEGSEDTGAGKHEAAQDPQGELCGIFLLNHDCCNKVRLFVIGSNHTVIAELHCRRPRSTTLWLCPWLNLHSERWRGTMGFLKCGCSTFPDHLLNQKPPDLTGQQSQCILIV
jgi:hypothetical protein